MATHRPHLYRRARRVTALLLGYEVACFAVAADGLGGRLGGFFTALWVWALGGMMVRTDRLPSWPGRMGVLVALALLAAVAAGGPPPRLAAAAALQGWFLALLAVTLRLLDRLAANARKLDRLVADLLDLDRLSHGRIEPRWAEVDLGPLAREVVAAGAELLGGRPVEVAGDPRGGPLTGSPQPPTPTPTA